MSFIYFTFLVDTGKLLVYPIRNENSPCHLRTFWSDLIFYKKELLFLWLDIIICDLFTIWQCFQFSFLVLLQMFNTALYTCGFYGASLPVIRLDLYSFVLHKKKKNVFGISLVYPIQNPWGDVYWYKIVSLCF